MTGIGPVRFAAQCWKHERFTPEAVALCDVALQVESADDPVQLGAIIGGLHAELLRKEITRFTEVDRFSEKQTCPNTREFGRREVETIVRSKTGLIVQRKGFVVPIAGVACKLD